MNTFQLRPVSAEDREFLYRVYASTRAEELAPVPWTPAQKEAFVRAQFEAQDHHYRNNYDGAEFLIIARAGQPAGRLYLHRSAHELRIIDIALLPDARAAGIGTRILRDLQAEAAGAGQAVTIHVERMNRALGFYERLGFKLAEDKGVYLFLRWEPSVDAPGGKHP